MTSIERTAYPRFKRLVSARELREAFMPEADEITWARGPMVERLLAWLVADGCRRVPYRGIERNQVWWSLRVAAVNLRRPLVLGLARHGGAWVLA